jgi:hypothetical protein
MDAYQNRNGPVSTERQLQTLRTIVASSGLLPDDRFVATDRHLALLAAADWDRLAHQSATRLGTIATGLARTRRWIGNALIRAGRRIEGRTGEDASRELALRPDGAIS